jgi:hypothetical protein
MSETEFLNWVRGPGMQISLAVFIVGMIYRVLENYILGRKRSLAEARGSEWSHGFNTMWRRSFTSAKLTTRG